MQITKIITDDTLRELTPHGSKAFPCEYYEDIIKAYDLGWLDWHWHRELEFNIVVRGEVWCKIGNTVIKLKEGEGIFINSKVIHSFETPDDGRLKDILFDPVFIAAETTGIYERLVYPVLNSDASYLVLKQEISWQKEILEWLYECFDIFEKRPAAMQLDIHILVCNIWSRVFSRRQELEVMETAGISMILQARLRLMIHFIEQNYSNRLSLADIALSANISKSEALRCFRSGMQDSPVHYLMKYRLGIAGALLAGTEDRITEIALHTGFESVNYFCRMFRRFYGISPGEYRKRQSN